MIILKRNKSPLITITLRRSFDDGDSYNEYDCELNLANYSNFLIDHIRYFDDIISSFNDILSINNYDGEMRTWNFIKDKVQTIAERYDLWWESTHDRPRPVDDISEFAENDSRLRTLDKIKNL